MTNLSKESCEACRADAPKVSDEALKELLGKIPDWNIEVRNGVMQLEKIFVFDNFIKALAFTNKVASSGFAISISTSQYLYGSSFKSSGLSTTSSFTATIFPDRGAYMSLAALTDSTTPIGSSLDSSSPTFGSSTYTMSWSCSWA